MNRIFNHSLSNDKKNTERIKRVLMVPKNWIYCHTYTNYLFIILIFIKLNVTFQRWKLFTWETYYLLSLISNLFVHYLLLIILFFMILKVFYIILASFIYLFIYEFKLFEKVDVGDLGAVLCIVTCK